MWSSARTCSMVIALAVWHRFWQFAHGGACERHGTVGAAVSRRFAVLPCLLLVACGAASNGGPVAGSAEPSASITVFAAASLAKVMPQVISAFESAHPSVKVAGDYEGTQALLTKLQADPAIADVFVS